MTHRLRMILMSSQRGACLLRCSEFLSFGGNLVHFFEKTCFLSCYVNCLPFSFGPQHHLSVFHCAVPGLPVSGVPQAQTVSLVPWHAPQEGVTETARADGTSVTCQSSECCSGSMLLTRWIPCPPSQIPVDSEGEESAHRTLCTSSPFPQQVCKFPPSCFSCCLICKQMRPEDERWQDSIKQANFCLPTF